MDRPGTGVRCNERSTWRHHREPIDAERLVDLVRANGGANNLDLHGADLTDIDLSAEALRKKASVSPEVSWWASIGWAVLEGAHLEEASLVAAHLGGANLRGAYLNTADLSTAHLQGADLHAAHLEGAHLIGTDLAGADLRSAHLEGAWLQSTILHGSSLSSAYLRGGHFEGVRLDRALLLGAHLNDVDLYEAGSLVQVSWYGAFLDRTRMRANQLGTMIGDEVAAHKVKTTREYRLASEAYLLLKNNFNSIGRYEDAAWSYVKEQQMEKMAYYWAWRSSLRKNWLSCLRWLRNWAYELLTGYGERAWMPVIWAVVVIAAFTVGYAVAGNVSPDFAGDPATAHGSHNPLDALTHSIGAFATIGFNTLEPLGWGARLLTAIESAFGIGLFALFIFTLGNRMSRS